jgi:hypothetical protein
VCTSLTLPPMWHDWRTICTYGYQQCVYWYSWSILIICYVLYSERDCCCNAQNYFAVACSYLMERLSFVSGNEWSQKDWRRTGMGTSSVCQVVYLVYVDHSPCPEFTNWQLMQCPPLFCCCLFLFDPEANICLQLVMNWVRVTEVAHVLVPAMCQIVY